MWGLKLSSARILFSHFISAPFQLKYRLEHWYFILYFLNHSTMEDSALVNRINMNAVTEKTQSIANGGFQTGAQTKTIPFNQLPLELGEAISPLGWQICVPFPVNRV